ncbi:MAG: sulfatase-like hydrolase/transferase [Clostridia bacterium]|nr:sulfatase-like hydrolase/transferase [Clostridia bacterium]
MLVTIVNRNSFIELENTSRWFLLFTGLVLPLVIGAAVTYTLDIKSEFFNKIFHVILIFLMPILSITMTECLNGVFIYDMTVLGFFANYMFVLLLYFLVFALSGSIKLAVLTVNPILYAFSIAHCYVMYFRGTPFLPMDFSGIKTGLNVVESYTFKLLYNAILGTFLLILIIVIGIKTKTPKFHPLFKITLRSFMGVFFGTLMFIFYFTPILSDAGVKPDFWNQSRGYRNYGFAFSFFCNTKYLYMTEPNGYTPDAIDEYVSENVVGYDEQTVKTPKSAPNLICIMNESLSDLKLLGEFETNEDYMPFMRSLNENTIKGNLYVPVIGAGTSNTEFEFLTGNSVAFLPSGSNAFILYIKNPMASLVSTLEAQGYSSLAFHPYYSSGWNRTSVYDFFGFNKFLSLENIIDRSILNEYADSGNIDYLQTLVDQYYPDRTNMLIRQYVSDSYDYKLIIEDFEARDKNKPYFVFNVTMQNHGGYTNSASNFNECIEITSSDTYYTKASKYLSLVKASDDAFKELIEYFKNVKEPTVICMFGDHQPSIETEFVSSIMGVESLSGLTIEQEQLRHATQFYIWANYDIEEQYIDKLSSNYLSSLLLQTAGLNKTEYNKYLLNLSKSLPVVDTVGYIDSENNYYRWSDETQYSEILRKYEKIQYNYIFDNENKKADMFYLNGFRIESKTEGGNN